MAHCWEACGWPTLWDTPVWRGYDKPDTVVKSP